MWLFLCEWSASIVVDLGQGLPVASVLECNNNYNETNSHNLPDICKIYELHKTMTYTYDIRYMTDR